MRKKGLCDDGITNFNISADGMIYPCTCLVNDKEYMIGSVFNGIDDSYYINIRFTMIKETQPVTAVKTNIPVFQ